MNATMAAVVLAMAGIGMPASLQAADAKPNWDLHCAKCHGADGKGDTKMGKKLAVKDYTSGKVQAELRDENGIKSIRDGMKDGDKTLMKPYGKSLSEDEIKALVKYMRSFKK